MKASNIRFADLDLAAVRHRRRGRDRQLVLWHALRAADAAGSGCLSRDQAAEAGRRLWWRPRRFDDVLEAGTGVFWRIAPDAVYLCSAPQVARSLGVTAFRAAHRAPLRDLRGPLATVRARLVIRAISALRGGRPVANATIAQMTGVDVRTVKRWKRLARVRSHENYALIAPLRPGTIAGDFRTLGGPALRTVRFRGRRWIARRVPDSFSTPSMGGVRSRLRRGNRRLRVLSEFSGGDPTRRRVHGVRRTSAAPSPTLYTILGMPHVPAVSHGTTGSKRVTFWVGVQP